MAKKKPTISPVTLTALDKSILKWEMVVAGKKRDGRGTHGCGLCEIYNKGKNECFGCPIMESTGEQYCEGTPYETYERNKRALSVNGGFVTREDGHKEYYAHLDEPRKRYVRGLVKANAEAMLKYLKNLRLNCNVVNPIDTALADIESRK